MRERVAALVGAAGQGDVGVDVPLRLRAHPAPRGRARSGSSRPSRSTTPADSPAADDAGLPRPRPRPEALPAAVVRRPGQQPQERAGRPRDVRRAGPRRTSEQTLAEAYTLYQRRLREANALDFDDLIMTTVHLLQAFPDVAEHYRRRFRHVLVDEYQDTNHAQYVLVRELVGRRRRRRSACRRPSCAWSATPTSRSTPSAARRSATSSSSSRTTRTPRTILLEQNYRSTQTILSAANAVIARNAEPQAEEPVVRRRRRRADRRLRRRQRARRGGVRRRARSTGSTDDDGRAARATSRCSTAPTRSPGSFEEVFIRVGLPYKVVGGVRFYERREVRDALAYLRVLANPADTVIAAAHPQRARSAASATGPRPASRRWPQRERITFGDALRRCEDARPGHPVADRRAGLPRR